MEVVEQQYKDTKIGKIPMDWEVVKIASHVNLAVGFAFKSEFFSENPKDIRLARGINITTGKMRWYEKITKYWKDTTNLEKYFLVIGDILIPMDGSKVGRNYAMVDSSDIPSLLVQRVARIRAKKSLNIKFLFQFFSGTYFQDYVDKVKTNTGIPHISSKDINNFTIPLPPLPEQKKIAAILSTVDEQIATTTAIIQQTQQLKKGLMQQLFSKGIGHTTFKKTKIGEIPESWEVVKGEEISILITKGSSPRWQGFEYQKKGCLFVTSENVRNGFLDISEPKFLPLAFNEKLKKSQLKKNDILINIVGASIGRGCLYESSYEAANINQAVCILRLNNKIDPHFVLYYLQVNNTIKRLLDNQAGSARANLSLTNIRDFKFILPPLSEQKKIATILTEVDDKIQAEQQQKARLEELKKGLMQVLLTGQVRVKI